MINDPSINFLWRSCMIPHQPVFWWNGTLLKHWNCAILFLIFLLSWLNGMNGNNIHTWVTNISQCLNHALEFILDPSLMQAFTECVKTENTKLGLTDAALPCGWRMKGIKFKQTYFVLPSEETDRWERKRETEEAKQASITSDSVSVIRGSAEGVLA